METIKHSFKVFAIFNGGSVTLVKDFVLLKDRYIKVGKNEPTPIEDYGNWMLFKNENISEDEAFDSFLENALFESPTGSPI